MFSFSTLGRCLRSLIPNSHEFIPISSMSSTHVSTWEFLCTVHIPFVFLLSSGRDEELHFTWLLFLLDSNPLPSLSFIPSQLTNQINLCCLQFSYLLPLWTCSPTLICSGVTTQTLILNSFYMKECSYHTGFYGKLPAALKRRGG